MMSCFLVGMEMMKKLKTDKEYVAMELQKNIGEQDWEGLIVTTAWSFVRVGRSVFYASIQTWNCSRHIY